MKTTKTTAIYAMLVGTLLGTTLVETSHADPLESQGFSTLDHGMRSDIGGHLMIESTGMRSDIGGHLMIESSGIRKRSAARRGMYRDRGKSSPKIAHGMRRDAVRYEIELAFERGDFGLAFELLDELDPRLGRPPVRR